MGGPGEADQARDAYVELCLPPFQSKSPVLDRGYMQQRPVCRVAGRSRLVRRVFHPSRMTFRSHGYSRVRMQNAAAVIMRAPHDADFLRDNLPSNSRQASWHDLEHKQPMRLAIVFAKHPKKHAL